MDIGYLRVSTTDQSLDRQRGVLPVDKVFEEHASASTTDRPVLLECFEFLREGDTLHVVSIDRLARNLGDLQRIVEMLNQKGVSVCFKKENLSFGVGEGNPMNKLMLQMMGAFAEFERALIRERQREGIAKAKSRGQKLGRPLKLTDEIIQQAKQRCMPGVNKAIVARELGISRTALYRALTM